MTTVLPRQKSAFATLQYLELEARVADLTARYGGRKPEALIRALVQYEFPGKVAVVSSFGAESAVLLHMVAAIDVAVPVIFLDTLRHFPATLNYQTHLATKLGLRNVIVTTPDPAGIAAEDPDGQLAQTDPDRCCHVRKTLPMIRAVQDFGCLLTGRKRFQSETRTELEPFETQGRWIKANPIWAFSKKELQDYFVQFALPAHPMEKQGFLSIGCEPCTSAVNAGENSRAGRWSRLTKTECGIHSGLATPTDARSDTVSPRTSSAD